MAKLAVLAVFHAACKASLGDGNNVALVQGESGKCRLYGCKSLVNAGILPASMDGKSLSAVKLAKRLDVKLIDGKNACLKFIADNKLSFSADESVIGDAVKGTGKAGSFGRSIDFTTF